MKGYGQPVVIIIPLEIYPRLIHDLKYWFIVCSPDSRLQMIEWNLWRWYWYFPGRGETVVSMVAVAGVVAVVGSWRGTLSQPTWNSNVELNSNWKTSSAPTTSIRTFLNQWREAGDRLTRIRCWLHSAVWTLQSSTEKKGTHSPTPSHPQHLFCHRYLYYLGELRNQN